MRYKKRKKNARQTMAMTIAVTAALAILTVLTVSRVFVVRDVMVVGNLFEVGENQRFRALVEPLTWLVASAALAQWWRRWRAPQEPTGEAATTSPTGTTASVAGAADGPGSRNRSVIHEATNRLPPSWRWTPSSRSAGSKLPPGSPSR